MPPRRRSVSPPPPPSPTPFLATQGAPGGPVAPGLARWVSRRLLPWFARVRRDLPWRRTRDPYAIWVSEVMLQQTQVVTVVPYFERFLQAFPTIGALAGATEHEVLMLWEGLGYYRRARDLHRAARELAGRTGGAFPDTPEALAGLPGFGEYTRNAVLSQAFDRRLPILEANSQRVLSRLLGREEDPRGGPARRWLWKAAEALLPTRRVGEFNQALMELGALVCTPVRPRCGECPLAARCQAWQSGRQDQIPMRTPPPETTFVQESAVVVRRRSPRRERQVLLARRPAGGRWAGMWEFPHGELQEGEMPLMAAARLTQELTGLDVRLGAEVLTIRHTVTRFRITMVCFEGEYRKGTFRSQFYVEARWVGREGLGDFPVSAPQRRLARALGEEGNEKGGGRKQ